MTAEQIAQTLAGEPDQAGIEADQVRAALDALEQDGEITAQRDDAGDRYRLLDTGGG
jgi:DNA-binding transcriptional regulator PaaX